MTSAVNDEAAVGSDRVMRFGGHAYPHLIRSGLGCLDEFAGLASGLDPGHWVLVCDAGVPREAVDAVAAALGAVAPVIRLETPAEETRKTWTLVGALGEQAIRLGANRRSVVVGLGGGLAGNVAGVLACNLFRGVPLILVPTTLLAASDSAMSRKQAVNSSIGKNHYGGYWTPALVWVQLDFLMTLPPEQVRSACCEAIKNVVAICPQRFPDLAGWLNPDAVYSTGELAWLISMCAEAKQAVMTGDPQEKGPALAALELGHLVAHALEMHTRGGVSHGLAVGLGGLVAGRTAALLGIGGQETEAMFDELLLLNGAPVTFREALAGRAGAGAAADFSLPEALVRIARSDNKQGYRRPRQGWLPEVLLEAPGRPHRTAPEPDPPAGPWGTLRRPHRDAATYITLVPESVLGAAIRSRLG